MADTQTPEIINPQLPAQAGKELGQSGTYIFNGFISAEEYNSELRGKYGLQVYDTMRRSDATVHATLMVCKNPIIGATWDIEPASDDATDIEVAGFVRQELFKRRIMWQDVLREALTCLDFGHAIAEKVYELSAYNGSPRIGLAKLASRKQRSIMRWETSDHQPGITQITPTGGLIDIPREKLVYIVNEQEGDNYEGISLLRFAFKPWKIKDALEIMNAIALERMSLGIPVVEKDEQNAVIDEAELAKVRIALKQMRNNEEAYLEIPSGLKISMLNMGANNVKNTLPTIVYNDRQITLSVLAQFLELGASGGGSGSSGSRAVSQDHSALFTKSLEAVARTIQQAFQRDVVQPLCDLNYSGLDKKNGYPKLIFSNISDENASETATAVSALMTAGALTPDADVENRLRQLLNLPPLPKDVYENYDEKGQSGQKRQQSQANAEALAKAKEQLPAQQPKQDAKQKASLDAQEAQAKLLAAIFEEDGIAA